MLTANSNPSAKAVLIKTGPSCRIRNESEVHKLCQGHDSIRQMVDVIDHPQSLVLEYLDRTVYDASCERKLERKDIKRAIKTALDGLAFLHAHKRAHTGNIYQVTQVFVFILILYLWKILNQITFLLITVPAMIGLIRSNWETLAIRSPGTYLQTMVDT